MRKDRFDEFRRAVSDERLRPYRGGGEDESAADVLARYAWNVALSEALYPSLQALGVALRNSLHAAIEERFGDGLWFFSDNPEILSERERRKAEEARRELARRGKDATLGRVVAELNFGF
jgi:hypothetical protein